MRDQVHVGVSRKEIAEQFIVSSLTVCRIYVEDT